MARLLQQDLTGDDCFVLDLRIGSEPTADAAGTGDPKPVALFRGGETRRGEGRWLFERLREIEHLVHVFRYLLQVCLTEEERVKCGLAPALVPADVDDLEFLCGRGFFTKAMVAVANPSPGAATQRAKFSLYPAARLVVRSSFSVARKDGAPIVTLRESPWK